VDPVQKREIVEALLFASDAPLRAKAMADVIGEGSTEADVREAVAELSSRYVELGAAFSIEEIAGGYQILTRGEFEPWVRKLQKARMRTRLSRAALETLALIAYRQPLSRPHIEDVRGVDAGGVLTTLLERGLVKVAGRAEGPGRPLLYGTTPAFLEHFGLSSLTEMPPLDELAQALDRKLVALDIARELGEDAADLDAEIASQLGLAPDEGADAEPKTDPVASAGETGLDEATPS
jgi:segregation and condensation protein B